MPCNRDGLDRLGRNYREILSEWNCLTHQKQVSIDAEYAYAEDDTCNYFVVFTNNSKSTIRFEGSLEALDKKGNVIGSDDASTDAVGPGCTSILSFSVFDAKGAENFEGSYDASEEGYYASVLEDLSVEASAKMDKKAIVKVANNGEKTAEYTVAHVLFFAQVGYLAVPAVPRRAALAGGLGGGRRPWRAAPAAASAGGGLGGGPGGGLGGRPRRRPRRAEALAADQKCAK